MISVKYAIIIAIGAFASGSFFASPVPQAIASTIANDVQCSGCVGTSDLAGNAVTSAKIKNGEVKAIDIATDAVGASELQGVTKLIFKLCSFSDPASLSPGFGTVADCAVPGATTADRVIATNSGSGDNCFAVTNAKVISADLVRVTLRNVCAASDLLGSATIAIIVFNT